ncbi:MLO-like protein 8 [Camellia sinensis]|uniref:MLO-like protein 8 n=1 Tax=Camellia sinensis TaxID=4442 RepID=UPI001036E710|nr:MLO-like protein 8 [Camellia sinensis]
MNFGFETQFTQKAFLNAGLNNERIKKSNLYCLEFLCFTSIFSFFIGFSPIRNNVYFQWFRQRRKKPMLEALKKIKAELMVLGFISLLLTFGQHYIANICIPIKLADTMFPCPMKHPPQHHGPELNLPHEPDELNAPHEPKHVPDEHNLPLDPKHEPEHVAEHHTRLLWYEHRFLAGDSPVSGCKKVLPYLLSQEHAQQ